MWNYFYSIYRYPVPTEEPAMELNERPSSPVPVSTRSPTSQESNEPQSEQEHVVVEVPERRNPQDCSMATILQSLAISAAVTTTTAIAMAYIMHMCFARR